MMRNPFGTCGFHFDPPARGRWWSRWVRPRVRVTALDVVEVGRRISR